MTEQDQRLQGPPAAGQTGADAKRPEEIEPAVTAHEHCWHGHRFDYSPPPKRVKMCCECRAMKLGRSVDESKAAQE